MAKTLAEKQVVKRITILKAIGDCLASAKQWQDVQDNIDWASRATGWLSKAESLIELLEVEDCGSIGGFDKGQPHTNSLFERWLWLYMKYDDPACDRFNCNSISFKDLREYFGKKTP